MVDLGLMAASRGVVGINVHGGLGSCQQGGTIAAPWYSPLCALSDGQLVPRPEYYGLLLIHQLEGSTFLPVMYRSSHRVAIYALRASDGTLQVVVDDMDALSHVARSSHPRARSPQVPINVMLHVDPSYRTGRVLRLTAPSVQSSSGVTLGRVPVSPDGTFKGSVSDPLSGGSGRFQVTVNPGTATLVTLAP
jgi:hypothetical protein